MSKNLLLVNPWIYDFAAFDLWSKPLGLLYIASFLRYNNFNINYIDCLDKYGLNQIPKIKKYGQGNFYREEIEKPVILKEINRKYARYGIPETIWVSVYTERCSLPDMPCVPERRPSMSFRSRLAL